MPIIQIAISNIRVPEGRRALDPVRVAEIAASIKLLGMLSPIGVRRHGDAPVELVWGGHRLAASQSLGHKMIAAIAVDHLGWDHGHRENADLDDFVKMTEIAENLHRSDLTTQERNEQLAIWVALLEKRTPISDAAQPNSKKPGPKPSRAVAEVAKVSGLSTKTVKEAIKTTKVSPEVKAAADDAGLTSKQRLAISRLPEADQLAGVSKMAAINVVADRTEKAAAAKSAKPMSDPTPVDDEPKTSEPVESCMSVTLRKEWREPLVSSAKYLGVPVAEYVDFLLLLGQAAFNRKFQKGLTSQMGWWLVDMHNKYPDTFNVGSWEGSCGHLSIDNLRAKADRTEPTAAAKPVSDVTHAAEPKGARHIEQEEA